MTSLFLYKHSLELWNNAFYTLCNALCIPQGITLCRKWLEQQVNCCGFTVNHTLFMTLRDFPPISTHSIYSVVENVSYLKIWIKYLTNVNIIEQGELYVLHLYRYATGNDQKNALVIKCTKRRIRFSSSFDFKSFKMTIKIVLISGTCVVPPMPRRSSHPVIRSYFNIKLSDNEQQCT